jgi:hypothetical protein
LIAWGATKKEVAQKLFISYNTVDSHSKNIYRKLEICKETELTRIYFIETYEIPVEKNPIQEKIIAIFLLLLVCFSMFQHAEIIRVQRTASRVTKTSRSGRRSKEDYYC